MVLCNLDFLRLGRGTKRKVMGTMVLVTCTGSISRYMKARLSQKIKGGLACFVFLLFFPLRHLHFFCILGQRGFESSHLRFLSSTAFGRGQGGYVSRASRGFLFSIFSPEIFCLALVLFLFFSFIFSSSFDICVCTFFLRCFLLIYTTLFSKTAGKGRLEI